MSTLQLLGWLMVLAALGVASECLRLVRIRANAKPPPKSRVHGFR